MQQEPCNSSPYPLQNQAVLVTGGASGLGAALAKTLLQRGAQVMLADVSADQAQSLAATLRSDTSRVQAMACDVGDPAQAERAVAQTVEAFGSIDVLINNAGIDITCSLTELDIAMWDRILRTNLHGPFLLARAAARQMMGKGRGQIINITSTAAKRAWPNAAAYHASKTGLLGLSHALHAELRPAGIKVTAIVAGGMLTPFIINRFPDIDRTTLQDPADVALAICDLLALPEHTVVAEMIVLPMQETSWP